MYFVCEFFVSLCVFLFRVINYDQKGENGERKEKEEKRHEERKRRAGKLENSCYIVNIRNFTVSYDQKRVVGLARKQNNIQRPIGKPPRSNKHNENNSY